ncbi:MAG: S8 family serine peptidase [Salinibacter sp.]
MHRQLVRRLRRLSALLGLSVAILAASLAAQPPHNATPGLDYPFRDGHLLVRFKAGVSQVDRQNAHAAIGAKVVKGFNVVNGLQYVRLPANLSVKEAITRYRRRPNVRYAEPDFIQRLPDPERSPVGGQATPNDPQFDDLWGLNNTGQTGGTSDADIDAPEAWDIQSGSSEIVIFVIDTGGDYTHEDLKGNRWTNPGETPGNGIDDDGNGYVDDVYGIDTANGDSDPMDNDGHGTHISGTIGAVGDNNTGVTGVNWEVEIGWCKFLDGGGTTADAIECLDYVRDLKVNHGVNVVATNNSWGGSAFSQALLDAIRQHRKDGILFTAAAGNAGTDNDANPFYPAAYRAANLISVASTTDSDALSDFSNFGDRTVDLGAPGSAILSTTLDDTYSQFSGTSMATPHVTGVAALLKAQDPNRNWRDIRNLILSGGDDVESMDGTTATSHRLNAEGSLGCASAPTEAIRRPIPETLTIGPNGSVLLEYLSVDCAGPNGPASVAVSGPSSRTISLADDGSGADLASSDGTFAATWTPSSAGQYTLTYPNNETITVNVLEPYDHETGTYQWRSISGTNLNLTDDDSAAISLPFPVNIGGVETSTLYAQSNGGLTLNNTIISWSNASLPTSSVDNLLGPWWDDLRPISGSSQNVFWDTVGSSPERELVVEWHDVPFFNCADDESVRFQIVIPEADSAEAGNVLFQYRDTTAGGGCGSHDDGASATVGIQVGSGTATEFSHNSAALSANRAICWRPSSKSTCSVLTEDMSSGATVFRVERQTGNVFAEGSFNSGGADLAERIRVSEPVEPGDVVAIDPQASERYRKTRQAHSELAAGVVASDPGVVLGANATTSPSPVLDLSLPTWISSTVTISSSVNFTLTGLVPRLDAQPLSTQPVMALMGQVPVKATTANGPIEPGDLLVSASKPGYAMRCDTMTACEGAIVGKALEALDEDQGTIRMLVIQ